MPPVTQGKKISEQKLYEIKPNMTKSEVTQILGSPDIVDIFNPNQYIYVNTRKKIMQSKRIDELKLVLTFNNNDELTSISGNYPPPSKKPVF